jgi:hypothetical protein
MGDSWLMTQFAWNLIDHTLVGLKLSDLSEEMRKSIEDEERQIRDDNRLNQNSQAVPSLLVQMHERRTDEWAENRAIERPLNLCAQFLPMQSRQSLPRARGP